jgi:hypothetical protein
VGLFILLGVLVLLIIGGSLGFAFYSNGQNKLHVSATATAVASNAQAAATQQAVATATTIASTYPFSTNQVLNDPMVDNSKNAGIITMRMDVIFRAAPTMWSKLPAVSIIPARP